MAGGPKQPLQPVQRTSLDCKSCKKKPRLQWGSNRSPTWGSRRCPRRQGGTSRRGCSSRTSAHGFGFLARGGRYCSTRYNHAEDTPTRWPRPKFGPGEGASDQGAAAAARIRGLDARRMGPGLPSRYLCGVCRVVSAVARCAAHHGLVWRKPKNCLKAVSKLSQNCTKTVSKLSQYCGY